MSVPPGCAGHYARLPDTVPRYPAAARAGPGDCLPDLPADLLLPVRRVPKQPPSQEGYVPLVQGHADQVENGERIEGAIDIDKCPMSR